MLKSHYKDIKTLDDFSNLISHNGFNSTEKLFEDDPSHDNPCKIFYLLIYKH